MTIAEKLTTIAENQQKVYEAGAKSEYDKFWDELQENGNREDYRYFFASLAWNDITFRPKYDMKPLFAEGMFWGCHVTDLRSILEQRGITIDFSECMWFKNMLAFTSTITHMPTINVSSAGWCDSIFDGASRLKSASFVGIQKYLSWDSAFYNCTSLTDITFEGEIGNHINIRFSPLKKASIISLINALSTTVTNKSVNLNKIIVNSAFKTEEGLADGSTSQEWLDLIETKPNWTISLF